MILVHQLQLQGTFNFPRRGHEQQDSQLPTPFPDPYSPSAPNSCTRNLLLRVTCPLYTTASCTLSDSERDTTENLMKQPLILADGKTSKIKFYFGPFTPCDILSIDLVIMPEASLITANLLKSKAKMWLVVGCHPSLYV